MQIIRKALRRFSHSQRDAVHLFVLVVDGLLVALALGDLQQFFQERLQTAVENGQQALHFLSEGIVVIVGIGADLALDDDPQAFLTLKRRS